MLQALKNFLDQVTSGSGAVAPSADTVELATAVLLAEVMRADAGVDPRERETALHYLRDLFGMPADEVDGLLALADERSRKANDFFAFTSVLNERLSQAQKIDVVERMWRIALADTSADPGETHIISKVAGLLHVTHGEYIAAKMRAQQGP